MGPQYMATGSLQGDLLMEVADVQDLKFKLAAAAGTPGTKGLIMGTSVSHRSKLLTAYEAEVSIFALDCRMLAKAVENGDMKIIPLFGPADAFSIVAGANALLAVVGRKNPLTEEQKEVLRSGTDQEIREKVNPGYKVKKDKVELSESKLARAETLKNAYFESFAKSPRRKGPDDCHAERRGHPPRALR